MQRLAKEEAGDGQRGPDAGAAGAAAADAAAGAARAAGAVAGASETCLLPCHILCFCHYATRQAFEQCFGPHLLLHQQNVDFSLTIILLFYMLLSCLPLSQRVCALRMRSVCALRKC